MKNTTIFYILIFISSIFKYYGTKSTTESTAVADKGARRGIEGRLFQFDADFAHQGGVRAGFLFERAAAGNFDQPDDRESGACQANRGRAGRKHQEI